MPCPAKTNRPPPPDPIVQVAAAGWDQVFVLCGILFLLYQSWRGWKLGIIRAGLKLLSLIGSVFIGWYGGMLLGLAVGMIFPDARIPVWIGAGVIIGIVVFLGLQLASMLLFKKTEHQRTAPIRWVFGLGGAFFGFLTGMVFLWAVISGVRAFGGVAEASPDQEASRGTSTLAAMKRSFEEGRVGGLIRGADPIPDSLYQTITKFVQVSSDQEALYRMLEVPEVQEIINHPKMVALSTDPDIVAAAGQRNIFALALHPLVFDLARDPELMAMIRKLDLEKALDYALENPSTQPRLN